MIFIPTNKYDNFDKSITKFKAIKPIKIESPQGYILPESILNDEEIVNAIPELLDLQLINEKDITFIEYNIN